MAGFSLYLNNQPQNLFGCSSSSPSYPFPYFELGQNEVVLKIDTCYATVSGYYAVNTVTIQTNLRQFGPIGYDYGSCTTYEMKGYNLVGARGSAHALIDDVSFAFEKC